MQVPAAQATRALTAALDGHSPRQPAGWAPDRKHSKRQTQGVSRRQASSSLQQDSRVQLTQASSFGSASQMGPPPMPLLLDPPVPLLGSAVPLLLLLLLLLVVPPLPELELLPPLPEPSPSSPPQAAAMVTKSPMTNTSVRIQAP